MSDPDGDDHDATHRLTFNRHARRLLGLQLGPQGVRAHSRRGNCLEPHRLSGLDSPFGHGRTSPCRIPFPGSTDEGDQPRSAHLRRGRRPDRRRLDPGRVAGPARSRRDPASAPVYALTRAVTGDRVRYLLADEVGLGKTIEAGLIFRELKLRGLVKRVLVVAPKGLVPQWVQEMQTHFGEEFRLLIPSEFSAWRNFTGAENVWRQFDQVVCPADSIKPIERRRGWSREKLEAYNQERLGDLIDAGWDLIICDEAHRLGGSTEQVARYRLGKALAEAAPYLLLLSATPHQGKTAGFQRLMALLDRDEFIDAGSIRRERVVPFVIRTEKRRAINDRGDPLFMPRVTKLMPVRWGEEKHRLQKHLYESVTEYVRLGYNQAMRQNRQYVGFTEFVPTQYMLRDFLEQHGFSVVCLNGSMELEERRRVQRQFAEKARILVSTDAGGEGLNLQFAHIVINFDLPWNPMRIEQRIGRVDRIGQTLPVKAFNLIFEDSVELRVQEVLEDKLATILDEFGVDKTQDVLDSAESGAVFERLYAQAILNPGDIEKNIDRLIAEVREQAKEEIAGRSYYGETVLGQALAQKLSSHPLPFWVEPSTTGPSAT